jgi:two-component system, OmpR family, phosphate regulon response regulator PhoB
MGCCILSVDDNVPLQTTRKLLLSQVGYKVLTAATADEARRLLRSQAIDLVLLDYYLPDALGDELCVEFKRWNPKLRVILVSGAIPDKDCACADRFFLKGDGPAVLLEAIASLLKRAA